MSVEFKSITVFCGATSGRLPEFEEAAYQLGRNIAEGGYELVYGGGSAGMMGAVANGTVDYGGKVTGVIPQFLVDRELAHQRLHKLEIVETMHERKAIMNELGDAIISLPGGAGTFEEFFEMYTWGQIGLHEKPLGLINTRNYFDPLLAMFDKMISEEYLDDKYMKQLFLGEDFSSLIHQFKDFEPVEVRTYKDLQKGHRS